jgi:2-keto-4-pentenoate hydratase
MLSSTQIDQAARHLVSARQASTPGPCLAEGYRPTDIDSALAIQRRVLELLGQNIGGWKCGVPGPAGPILSPIPAPAIYRSLPCPVPGAKGQIEPEIAFVLGRDLAPREQPYSDDEIRGAIGEARLAIELITSRYADKASATHAEILADSFNNHGLYIGPVIPNVLANALETLHVTIRTPERILFDKDHRHPSGHPMNAFSWLVRFLNQRGEGLKAGQIVTTGSYAGIVEAPLETPVQVQLDALASLEITLISDKK